MSLLKKLLRFTESPNNEITSEKQIQIATCILLIEVSKSDDNFDKNEINNIKDIIKNKFILDDDELNNLFEKCNTRHEEMTSLYEWTDIINSECSYAEKLKIINYMWQIAFTDSIIDKYEDYTIRKVCDLIHVKHKDFINLKEKNSTSI